MKKINIIIPTYNESKNILPLIKEIKRYLPDANICVVACARATDRANTVTCNRRITIID